MSSKGSYFRRKRGKFWMLLIVLTVIVVFKAGNWESVIGLKNGPQSALANPTKDDWNRDGAVDLEDVKFFSSVFLLMDWREVDWCTWLDSDAKEKKHMGGALEAFIREYFQCDVPPYDPLAVENENLFPTRLEWGAMNDLYVCDDKAGSVFIYQAYMGDADDKPDRELKGLDRPLGIIVDSQGNIYVGNNGRDNVEVYDPEGNKIATIGEGQIQMPNDLAFDADGNLYVADSKSAMIRVYDVNGTQIRTISHAEMKFPSSICIDYRDDAGETPAGELYAIGPTDNYIRVFDLEGSLLRSFGGDVIKRGGMGGTTWYWREKFVRPQSVRIDSLGRAHVLDGFIGNVQILDRDTGTYISHYGAIGTNPGEFRIPIGIDINDMGDVAVSDYGNRRIQLLYTVPAPVQ